MRAFIYTTKSGKNPKKCKPLGCRKFRVFHFWLAWFSTCCMQVNCPGCLTIKLYCSLTFWWNKNVSKYIFVFFENKVVESKYNILFWKLTQKNAKHIFVFHWNPYLKTDSANFLILFSVNDFNTRIRENFYIIFVRGVNSFLKLEARGQVILHRAAAAWWCLLFCQNLGRQLPLCPPFIDPPALRSHAQTAAASKGGRSSHIRDGHTYLLTCL